MRTWLRRVPWVLLLGLILVLATRRGPSHPETPAWCSALPRPEYKPLERVSVSDPWFEVYRVAPGVLAIYEPHQAEEVISYLIVGTKQAALFDTGMGDRTSSWWLGADGEWVRHDRSDDGTPLADLQTDLMAQIGSRRRATR